MNAYQISPKNIHWFSGYYLNICLLFGTSAVPTTSFGSNNLTSLKCGRCCVENNIYHHVLTMVLVYDLKNRQISADVTNSKQVFKCITPLESENCKFEIKYFRIKAIFVVVSAQTGKCKPRTRICHLNSKLMLRWDGDFKWQLRP